MEKQHIVINHNTFLYIYVIEYYVSMKMNELQL